MGSVAHESGHAGNTETVAAAIGAHDDLLVVRLDITDPEQAAGAAAAAVERFGRIDVLVNNAGNFIAGFFEEISPAQVQAQVGTLLFGTIAVTERCRQRCGQTALGRSC